MLSNLRVHTASNSHYKYLVPVCIRELRPRESAPYPVFGLLVVVLASRARVQWRSQRWHSHMSARKSLLRLRVRSAVYTNDGLESTRLALPTTACSPSKYTCHGAPCVSRPLILAVARAGSRLHHSSTHRSSSPPSQVRPTRAATPSHSLQVSKSSTRAR